MECARCGCVNAWGVHACQNCGQPISTVSPQATIISMKPRHAPRLVAAAAVAVAVVAVLAITGGGAVAFNRWADPERNKERSAASLPPVQTDDQLASTAGTAVLRVESAGCGISVNGSGFVVAPHLVVTNWHLVAVDPTPTLRLRSGTAITGRTIGANSARDVAVIETAETLSPTLSWAEQSELQEGSHLFALGYKEDAPWLEGIASTAAGFENVRLGKNALVTTAPVDPGSSGGPMLTDRGRVAGIMVVGGSGPSIPTVLPQYIVQTAIENATTQRPGVKEDCSIVGSTPQLTPQTIPPTTVPVYVPETVPSPPTTSYDFPDYPDYTYPDPPTYDPGPTYDPVGPSFGGGVPDPVGPSF